ncbi:hypothetical protein G6F57_015142 [Rhizopus arrhizus]|nr:hypothetical protein G6F57_015142 [Rhizopus arrhizus]
MHVAWQDAARHAVDQQGDEDGGKRQLDVGDAHDEAVDAAAGVAADEAERHAQHHREQHRGKPHQQRYAGAIQHGRQDVAALVVGAQQEVGAAALFPGRRRVGVHAAERRQGERVVRRDDWREQRAQQDGQRHGGGNDGARRTLEAVPQGAVGGAGKKGSDASNHVISFFTAGPSQG